MSIRVQRGPVRAALRRTLDELKDSLAEQEKDQDRIDILFRRAKRHMERLRDLDEQVQQFLLENDAPEEDFVEEYDAVTQYRDDFEELEQLASPYLKRDDDGGSISTRSGTGTTCVRSIANRHTTYRLPHIEMKKFGGDAKDWIGFWSQFSRIHEDDDIGDDEKFQYLLQSTVEATPARAVVESFPPSAANYPKVVKYLKERFGRDEILVEVYVRELLGLVISNIQKKGFFPVASIYDKLETQLRSLESLGVTSEKYAAMLFPLVESSLPEDLLRSWERSRSRREQDGDNQLSSLMKFIRCEVDTEERVRLAKKGFHFQDERKVSPKKQERNLEVPTATDLYSGQAKGGGDGTCVFCQKMHESSGCYQAQMMTYDDRQKRVREYGACFICLKKGHVSKECKANPHCPLCDHKHLLIMCPKINKDDDKKKKQDSSAEAEGRNTPSLSNHCEGNVLLQTLLVKLKNNDEERIVRAIVDTGSQFSYITSRAAKVLKLKRKDQVKMGHGLFGGTETCIQQHNIYEVQVDSCEGNTGVSMVVLEQKKLCGKVSRVPPGIWLEEMKRNGIIISDVGEDCPDIHLLIGADLVAELLTGRMFTTMSGPVAMETKLGWTMIGKYPLEEKIGLVGEPDLDSLEGTSFRKKNG